MYSFIQQNKRYHHLYSTRSSFFPNSGTYITHNAIKPLSDITGGSKTDYMKRPLEPTRFLTTLFHICTSTPENTLKYVKSVELPFNFTRNTTLKRCFHWPCFCTCSRSAGSPNSVSLAVVSGHPAVPRA